MSSRNDILNQADAENLKTVYISTSATNGDAIKALFPNIKTFESGKHIETDLDEESVFNLDWWNAPYQKGESK